MFNLVYDAQQSIIGISSNGVSLPYDSATETFDETNLLVIELRKWEVANNIDLIAWGKRDKNAEYLEGKVLYTQRFDGLLPEINSNTTKWQVGVGAAQIVDAYTDPRQPIIYQIKNSRVLIYDIPSELDGATTVVYAYYDRADIAAVADFSLKALLENTSPRFQEAAPVAGELADKLFLCAIISSDGININSVIPISLADEGETKNLLNHGPINVDFVSPQPITDSMRLSIPARRFKFAGRNAYSNPKNPHTVNLAAIPVVSYSLCDPEGNVLSTETDFNFNRYWDGTQITALQNSNFATLQFFYQFPSGAVAVILGQNEYTTLSLAATQWEYYEKYLPDKFKNNSYFYGAIAGLGNATDIGNKQEVLALWR